jgi:DNA-binding MarR family transcriptional regulator
MSTTDLQTALDLSLTRTQVLRSMEAPLSGHGIGFSDFALLRELRNTPGGSLRRSELAARLGITTSGVARQLAPLERMGLVRRESNPRDARLALVVLTEAGERVTGEAEATAERAAGDALEKLWSKTDREHLGRLLATAQSR